MVELVEVEDEAFEPKPTTAEEDDDYYTDTDSSISSEEDDSPNHEETLSDRLFALRDMIPPQTRSYIASAASTGASYIKSGLTFGGKTLFVLSTSALLLGVPWALAFAEEQQVLEMEKEMRMREVGGEILGQGSGSTASQLSAQLGAQQGKPAL